jgi:N-acetylmuramoyl-L-alanine amidase
MKQIRLCIDAGHGQNNTGNGGFDTGATAGGMRECDIALAWALTLKHHCVLAQIPVFMTRDDNAEDARLAVRDERAEQAGCTHLISIHCNSGAASATGVETFYRVRQNGVLAARDKDWAQMVQAAGVSATGLKNRGVKHESDRVPTSRGWRGRLAIFDFDGPAALLETGFISNLKDRSIIAVRETRIKFAEKLLAAILTTRSVTDLQGAV